MMELKLWPQGKSQSWVSLMVSWEMIRTNCAWKNNKEIFSIVDRWSRFHQNSEIYLPDNADAFVHSVIVSPAYLLICPMTKTRTVSVLRVVLQILTAIHICEYRFSTDIGHSWQAFWNQKPENDLKCCIYIYCSTNNYRPYLFFTALLLRIISNHLSVDKW